MFDKIIFKTHLSLIKVFIFIYSVNADINDISKVVIAEFANMNPLFRLLFYIFTLILNLYALLSYTSFFYNLDLSKKIYLIDSLRKLDSNFIYSYFSFFSSLIFLTSSINPPPRFVNNSFDVIVVGSGPGGLLTASALVNSGFSVAIIERGDLFGLNDFAPFGVDELLSKYHRGGMTIAIGTPPISYAEASCVGGGSEINSGLYHRIPYEILKLWSSKFKVKDLDEDILLPHYLEIEKLLNISYMPSSQIPLASKKLAIGADSLNWDVREIPRWYKYENDFNQTAIKQSMTVAVMPNAVNRGLNIFSGLDVYGIDKHFGLWKVAAIKKGTSNKRIFLSKYLFLCGGAISTPALLISNGLSRVAGRNLGMHPTVKLVARFSEKVNALNMGVPVHQVKEFSPRFSLGCSISTPQYLNIAMLNIPGGHQIIRSNWESMAIYYAMTTSGNGRILKIPMVKDPFVFFNLGKEGLNNLKDGLLALGRCMFAAGAVEIYPVVKGGVAIKNINQLISFLSDIDNRKLLAMTIHLFSSCPMGEDEKICGVNSYGAVFNQENLYVNDASLLCTPPGVNPQGPLMAIVSRNIQNFLESFQK